MERLQKWFGFGNAQNSESMPATGSNATVGNDRKSAISVATDATPKHMTDTENTSVQRQVESDQQNFRSVASEPETRVGQMLNQGREMILRVVPLTEGDCLSCKLIGSGAMWGAAAFVLFSYPRVKARYTDFRRKLVVFQVGSLATTLTLLGAARFFDLSVFSPSDEGTGGNRKSLGELLTDDLDQVYKYSSKLLSADSASDSKKGS